MSLTTTTSLAVAFVDAVKAALVADAPLMAIATGGVLGSAPRGAATTFPYVQLGRRSIIGDGFAMQKAGGWLTLQIDIWSELNGPYEASRLAGEVRRVLTRRDLTLTGFALVLGSVMCELDEVFSETDEDMPDRTLYHAVQRWRAMLEES